MMEYLKCDVTYRQNYGILAITNTYRASGHPSMHSSRHWMGYGGILKKNSAFVPSTDI